MSIIQEFIQFIPLHYFSLASINWKAEVDSKLLYNILVEGGEKRNPTEYYVFCVEAHFSSFRNFGIRNSVLQRYYRNPFFGAIKTQNIVSDALTIANF